MEGEEVKDCKALDSRALILKKIEIIVNRALELEEERVVFRNL
jgi:hypothetical protein